MQFNTLDFAIFLPIVFAIYWLLSSQKKVYQNIVLLVASYVFYGWWNPAFLLLIVFSSGVDFTIAQFIQVSNQRKKRKVLLVISIFCNLGILAYFKYANFFIDSFVHAFSFLGKEIEVKRLHLILPVGISFYTFQTLSYTIDVYRKKIEAHKEIISFFAYVSFFPQLVAGPIERASNLLPQFNQKRFFSKLKASDGLRQILWGLFKKIVIADNCAILANAIFDDYQFYSGSTLFFGCVFFAFQIYGDFSGYSDIAIGTARLFGFHLHKNFNFPFFAKNIRDFWKRWHISLTSWFRDYVYIPLGGNRTSTFRHFVNVIIVFVLSGLWHGSNWTFITWGLVHALLFLPHMLFTKRRYAKLQLKKMNARGIIDVIRMTFTFVLTTLCWVFFRADSISIALQYLKRMFQGPVFPDTSLLPKHLLIILLSFLIIEYIQRYKEHALSLNKKRTSIFFRWALYYMVMATIYFYGNFSETIEFIYFQF